MAGLPATLPLRLRGAPERLREPERLRDRDRAGDPDPDLPERAGDPDPDLAGEPDPDLVGDPDPARLPDPDLLRLRDLLESEPESSGRDPEFSRLLRPIGVEDICKPLQRFCG